MTRKEYKEFVKSLKQFKVELHSWLDILPTGDPIPACPIIFFPTENTDALVLHCAKLGFTLPSSTVWYVEGYHYPKGWTDRALVHTPDRAEALLKTLTTEKKNDK